MKMGNTVKQFLSEVFGEVRIFKDKEGNLWFVAQDIAKILDYGLTTDMTRGLEDDESNMQTLHIRSDNGVEQNRDMLTINESGLYSIVLSITKRNPERYEKARDFKRWITGTVIPSIRQNDGYIDKQEIMSDEMIMAKAILMANSVIENQKVKIQDQETIIKEQTPKVEKYNEMYSSEKLITPRDIAKDLGLKSAQELNKILHNNNIIYKFVENTRDFSRGMNRQRSYYIH
jgi:prophage antirepressor-like protein